MREREKETETRKGNVSTTGERNVKERKAGDKKERCKKRLCSYSIRKKRKARKESIYYR